MKALRLRNIDTRYFGYETIGRVLNLSPASARVMASRYVKAGLLLRVKRNIYLLKEKWNALSSEDLFQIANLIQTPSYISLMTALDYYQITTQLQQNFYESIALKRTKNVEISTAFFSYTKINPDLYFGFVKRQNFFIAEAEKAFLDAIYLASLGRYSMDLSSIDFSKFNTDKLNLMCQSYPETVKKMLKSYDYS